MKELRDHTEPQWCVAHNGVDVYTLQKVEVGQILTTGQPFLEIFENEEAARIKYNTKLPDNPE